MVVSVLWRRVVGVGGDVDAVGSIAGVDAVDGLIVAVLGVLVVVLSVVKGLVANGAAGSLATTLS